MFLSAEQITACIRWLSEQASPPVRYLTYRHILKADPQSQPMLELWKGVETSHAAEELFSRQNVDGAWFSGGPWGPRGYRRETGRGYTATRPKFVTTAWLLPFLGEMGFTAADERVRKACEFISQETSYESCAVESSTKEVNCCGLYAIPLRALASVGLAGDERLQGGWGWLMRCQRTDGGWLNPNHLADSPTPSKTVGRWPWDRSCVWGSYYAVQALYYAEGMQNEIASPKALVMTEQGAERRAHALTDGLEFLLWHLSQQDYAQLQTWVYHGHNLVKELLMFSAAGFDMGAQPIRAVLDWLKGYYRPDEGMFRTQAQPITDFTRHTSAIMKEFENRYGADYWLSTAKTGALRYHLYNLVEDDWLTYYLTRIALIDSSSRSTAAHPGSARGR